MAVCRHRHQDRRTLLTLLEGEIRSGTCSGNIQRFIGRYEPKYRSLLLSAGPQAVRSEAVPHQE